MGCTYSRPNGRRDPNIPSFKVHNVDVQGAELNRGRIEIREGDLVLYQKGKDEIRWPLRWLRRYGYEEELFSFESGRRCTTGNGIYAFKCCDAEALFNLVKETIERSSHQQQHQQQQQQPQQHPHRILAHGSISRSANRAPLQRVMASPVQPQGLLPLPGSGTQGVFDTSTMHYVNGPLMEGAADHEYINTGPPRSVSAAFQVDETTALVDFLHNPPSFNRGQTQLNYAEIEMPDTPASMENLLDESGLGAIHNVSRRGMPPEGTNRLSQPSLASAGERRDSARYSMPNDLAAAASQDSDSMLQAGDSDVFLDGTYGGIACSNYVNIVVDDNNPSKPADAAPPPFNLMLPAAHEMNYANLAFEQPKITSEVNYITIDHNAQTADNVPGVGGTTGQGAANSCTSPASPSGCASQPDSPSRKTRSYAKIDFDRTQALSNTARAQDDEEGTRKTRHNSSIENMP